MNPKDFEQRWRLKSLEEAKRFQKRQTEADKRRAEAEKQLSLALKTKKE
jgi:hypothetical protein